MTNRNKLLEFMYIFIREDLELIKEVFEIVNKRDWRYFCSEMGDYNQTEECKNICHENYLSLVMKIIDLFDNCNFIQNSHK